MSTRYNNGSHYENHQRAAELHDLAAHAHRAAEEHHGKEEHLTGHERSRQALEQSQDALRHTGDAHRHTQAAMAGHGIVPFGHDEIAALAYELWEARGRPTGSAEEDWFHAAQELRSRNAH